jgi:membrane peptidoglycan carboxypeptidase
MNQNSNDTLREILTVLKEKGPMSIDDVVHEIISPEQLRQDQAAGKRIRKVISRQIHPGGKKEAGKTHSLIQSDGSRHVYISDAGTVWLDHGRIDSDEAVSAQAEPQGLKVPVPRYRRFFAALLRRVTWMRILIYSSVLLFSVALLAAIEMRTSMLQSLIFSDIMSRVSWTVGAGESPRIEYPKHGPFDERLGYPLIPDLVQKMKSRSFEITDQAIQSRTQFDLLKLGVHAIYEEKHQGGLKILASDGRPIFSSVYPQHYYDTFEAIPPVIVRTLLIIENRDLLQADNPYKNPVFEWVRFGRAIIDLGLSRFLDDHDVPGGSTLATQIEKFRHSPDGRTHSVKEKAIQMISASLRSYRKGRSTFDVRKRIVQDYVNTVPLGAIPGAGEIRGLAHGLSAWHGVAFDQVNDQLKDLELKMDEDEGIEARALSYKQVLSLFLSQRRPAFYLQQNRDALKQLVDRHMNLLVSEGVLSRKFADKVRDATLTFRNNNLSYKPERQSFVDRKATDAIRIYLLGLFGFERLYSLDRLDLTVKATIDYTAQKKVTEILKQLSDPQFARDNGLMDNRLLARGNPANVTYSFTLREIFGDRSVLRVQSDNIDGPFNVNDGVKLELGSTAKLRTIVSYLQVIESVWRRHFDAESGKLRPGVKAQDDRLTRWTVDYLRGTGDKSLAAVLDAAMNRLYSASPTEKFFTGSGVHKFSNFTHDDDNRVVTMYEALRKSINLPFIRLMRDIIQHYIAAIPDAQAMLADGKNKTRIAFLEDFARKEGRQFLNRYYIKYRGKKPEEVARLFFSRTAPLKKVTNFYLLAYPDGNAVGLMEFARRYGGPAYAGIKEKTFEASLQEYRRPEYSLQDRGFVAGVHPLELWCATWLYNNPLATYTGTIQASDKARIESYEWLFMSKEKQKQDKRIRIMLEDKAFEELHASWVRVGYPFSFLVPTYATSIGSSGDKPSALADLMGVILSGGMRFPTVRIEEMYLAEQTPFETRMRYSGPQSAPTQVMSREVAETAKKALLEVVDSGTAQRVKGAFRYSDGSVIPVGGKTGTGDNKYSVYAAGGKVVESKTKNRTATFVFFIGDRHYGTLTAYVPNAGAKEFNFTSALPVQVLHILAPALTPLIDYQPGAAGAPFR